MNQTIINKKLSTDKEAREQLKSQLAEYLARQPETTQAAHKWMKRLEVAGLGIILVTFIFAMVVSFQWKSMPVTAIPAAWFLFVASALPAIILLGVHALILKAFPTVILPGKMNRFVTGGKAVGIGWFLILSGVVAGAGWVYLILKIYTSDYATMGGILGVVIGVGITLSLIASIGQQILQKSSRSR